MPDEHLSTALFRETRGTGIFRVLAGKTRLLMSKTGLERESFYRADGIAREESIREVYQLALSLRSDFRRVEDSYREADRQLRQNIVRSDQNRGTRCNSPARASQHAHAGTGVSLHDASSA